MDWQLDWQLCSSKINWIYLTHLLFARLRHTLGIPAVPTVDLRFWIYRTLSFLIFWGHFHGFGRYCVLLTKKIYIVFSTRMACRMSPRSPFLDSVNNSVTFVLYCFVVFVSPRKPNLDDFRGFKPSIAKYAFFNVNFYNYV